MLIHLEILSNFWSRCETLQPWIHIASIPKINQPGLMKRFHNFLLNFLITFAIISEVTSVRMKYFVSIQALTRTIEVLFKKKQHTLTVERKLIKFITFLQRHWRISILSSAHLSHNPFGLSFSILHNPATCLLGCYVNIQLGSADSSSAFSILTASKMYL